MGQPSFRLESPAPARTQALFIGPKRDADQQTIREAACSARWVENGSEAVVSLVTERPSVVFLDADAAGLDAARTITQLRESGHDVPVVLLASRSTSAEVLEQAAKAGLDDCVVRPFRAEHARALLRTPEVSSPTPRRRAPSIVAIAGPSEAGSDTGLVALLHAAGFHVVLLDSLRRAPELADLLVVDADLPGQQEVTALSEALRRVRPKDPNKSLPVLVLSAHVNPSNNGPAQTGIRVVSRHAPHRDLLKSVNTLLGERGVLDLRPSERVPFYCPVQFREAGGLAHGPWSSGFSFSVSAGGLFVRTLTPPRPGAALEVRIRLITIGDELSVTGVVDWSNPPMRPRVHSSPVGMGIQFLGAVSPKLSQLIELCRADAS
jgi:DNA-binding response OmpR family regulator/Tfp pilus assembly protein PilZ